MKIKLLFVTIAIITFSSFANAQKVSNDAKSSAAFAEVILRMTELEADMEGLLVNYTEEYPKVKEKRYELKILQSDVNKMSKIKASETGKLTQALGKLLVRKAQMTTDLWVLTKNYSSEHPDVQKAKRKLEIYQKAVKKIW